VTCLDSCNLLFLFWHTGALLKYAELETRLNGQMYFSIVGDWLFFKRRRHYSLLIYCTTTVYKHTLPLSGGGTNYALIAV